jgi:hypothetical protein
MSARISLSAFFLLVFLIAPVLGRGGETGQGAGQAAVACDEAVVYARMSTDSQKLKSLKKKAVVTVVLEVVGADGTWAVVREPGQRMSLGYVQGECLDWERPTFSMVRQVEPPVAAHAGPSRAETDAQTQAARPQGAGTDAIKAEVDRAVEARFSELLRRDQLEEGTAREVVEADAYGGFFWPFLPDSLSRQRRVPFVRHNGLSTAFSFPLSPSPSKPPVGFLNPTGQGAAFGFQITGGGFSRRR